MYFSTILTAALPALALASPTPDLSKRSLTAQQMVDNINMITQQSQALQPVISNIQSGDTAISKRQTNPFQPAIDGFQGIIQTGQTVIPMQDGTQPYADADAQKVCTAFHNVSLTA